VGPGVAGVAPGVAPTVGLGVGVAPMGVAPTVGLGMGVALMGVAPTVGPGVARLSVTVALVVVVATPHFFLFFFVMIFEFRLMWGMCVYLRRFALGSHNARQNDGRQRGAAVG